MTKRSGETHLSHRSHDGDVLATTLAAGKGCAWPQEEAHAGSRPMGGRSVWRRSRWCVGRARGCWGGLAGLDDDPEHGRADEAQRLAHPAEVVGEEWCGGEGETRERGSRIGGWVGVPPPGTWC